MSSLKRKAAVLDEQPLIRKHAVQWATQAAANNTAGDAIEALIAKMARTVADAIDEHAAGAVSFMAFLERHCARSGATARRRTAVKNKLADDAAEHARANCAQLCATAALPASVATWMSVRPVAMALMDVQRLVAPQLCADLMLGGAGGVPPLGALCSTPFSKAQSVASMVRAGRLHNNAVFVHLCSGRGEPIVLPDPESDIELLLDVAGEPLVPMHIAIARVEAVPGKYSVVFSLRARGALHQEVHAELRAMGVTLSHWTFPVLPNGFALQKHRLDSALCAHVLAWHKTPLKVAFIHKSPNTRVICAVEASEAVRVRRNIEMVLCWYGIPYRRVSTDAALLDFYGLVLSPDGEHLDFQVLCVFDVATETVVFSIGRSSKSKLRGVFEKLAHVLRVVHAQPTLARTWSLCPNALLVQRQNAYFLQDDGLQPSPAARHALFINLTLFPPPAQAAANMLKALMTFGDTPRKAASFGRLDSEERETFAQALRDLVATRRSALEAMNIALLLRRLHCDNWLDAAARLPPVFQQALSAFARMFV